MPFIWTSRERIVVDCSAVADTLRLPQNCHHVVANQTEFLFWDVVIHYRCPTDPPTGAPAEPHCHWYLLSFVCPVMFIARR
jgi:hypothetical protein